MVGRFLQVNVYWALVTLALALAAVYASADYVRRHRVQEIPAARDDMLERPVHVDFREKTLKEALTAVTREAGGKWGTCRMADYSVTIRVDGTVPLRVAVMMLVDSATGSWDPWLTTWEDSGAVFVGTEDDCECLTRGVAVYDVSDLVGDSTEVERERQMEALTRFVKEGAEIKVPKGASEQRGGDVEVYHFNEKLMVVGGAEERARANQLMGILRRAR